MRGRRDEGRVEDAQKHKLSESEQRSPNSIFCCSFFFFAFSPPPIKSQRKVEREGKRKEKQGSYEDSGTDKHYRERDGERETLAAHHHKQGPGRDEIRRADKDALQYG